MSTTGSVTLLQPQGFHSSKCPRCGAGVPHPQSQGLEEAHARIKDLESQISVLTLRATTAVERANEYETSLRRLNSTRSNVPANIQTAPRSSSFESTQATIPSAVVTGASTPMSATATPQSPPKSTPITATSRLARLLPSRSASAASAPPTSVASRPPPTPHASYPMTAGLDPSNLPPNTPQDLRLDLPASALVSPSPSEISLISALSHEQSLRKAAETAAAQTNNEIEELTGQLFEQANEMVAQERKARAKLENRVNVLEKREGEKSQRLQTLERRIGRVERVRGLLDREKAIDTSLSAEVSGTNDEGKQEQKQQEHP